MSIPLTYSIDTQHYLLRIPSQEDISRVFSATRVEGFNDGMQWDPPSHPDDLLNPLKRNIAAWEREEGFSFSIVSKIDAYKLLGRISIRKTIEEDQWDVGFWTHPEEQGKGIMTEALNAVLTFGFDTLRAESITAAYAVWNKASGRVLEKNGFLFVERKEEGFKKYDKWVAENIMVKYK